MPNIYLINWIYIFMVLSIFSFLLYSIKYSYHFYLVTITRITTRWLEPGGRSLTPTLELRTQLVYLSMPWPYGYAFFWFVGVDSEGLLWYRSFRSKSTLLIGLSLLLLLHQHLRLWELSLVEGFLLQVLMKQHLSFSREWDYWVLLFAEWSKLYCWRFRRVFLSIFLCMYKIAFLLQTDTLNLCISLIICQCQLWFSSFLQ